VSLAENVDPSANGGLFIFDDATPRPTSSPGFSPTGHLYDSLQWGADATSLFAANREDTGFDFYTLSVDASGVTLTKDFPNTFNSFANRIHFDAGTKLIYSDDGQVVDPSTGSVVNSFKVGSTTVSGAMVPDSSIHEAFFAFSGSSPNTVTIQKFDMTTFAAGPSITIPNVSGSPQRLIRWGQNGLAFNTSDGKVILVGGNFVH
jgi:hypothetical protein